jgi:hypothetical protein
LWIGRAAAAALVGAPEDDIADALETLVDANLLESPTPDWIGDQFRAAETASLLASLAVKLVLREFGPKEAARKGPAVRAAAERSQPHACCLPARLRWRLLPPDPMAEFAVGRASRVRGPSPGEITARTQ